MNYGQEDFDGHTSATCTSLQQTLSILLEWAGRLTKTEINLFLLTPLV